MIGWPSTATAVLFALAIMAAYLITGSFVNDRISPPLFFTAALVLIASALNPTAIAAVLSVTVGLTATIVHGLDHIHGNCGDDYKVLIGGRTYHKDRLGDYGWYRQCVQSAQAWWIMVVLTVMWMSALLVHLFLRSPFFAKRIALPDAHEATPLRSSSVEDGQNPPIHEVNDALGVHPGKRVRNAV